MAEDSMDSRIGYHNSCIDVLAPVPCPALQNRKHPHVQCIEMGAS
jgi:hypothetical protein